MDPRSDAAAAFILDLVSDACGVSRAAMLGAAYGTREVSAARHLAMYLMNVMLGWKMEAVGLVFRRGRLTVRYACACVEDRRDAPEFEALVSSLEEKIKGELEGGHHVEPAA